MEIAKLSQKTKCDFAGCKNMADVMFLSKNDSRKKMSFCEECLKTMYEVYAKSVTPKAVEAPFKKQKKLR